MLQSRESDNNLAVLITIIFHQESHKTKQKSLEPVTLFMAEFNELGLQCHVNATAHFSGFQGTQPKPIHDFPIFLFPMNDQCAITKLAWN